MFATEHVSWNMPYSLLREPVSNETWHDGTIAERSASCWSESLEKQVNFIEHEMEQPDADQEFWAREKLAVDDAREHIEHVIEPIERQIQSLQDQRRLLLSGISATLAKRHKVCNVAEFIGRDDPSGYLRW